MDKDEAIRIAYDADTMTLEELLVAYEKFHTIVENTPNWMPGVTCPDTAQPLGTNPGKPEAFQRSLHGAIGLCTEAAEVLDAHKKELYGKNKPLRAEHMREECGDLFFYLLLVMRAHGITFRDVIKDNVHKLANRYIEKFNV